MKTKFHFLTSNVPYSPYFLFNYHLAWGRGEYTLLKEILVIYAKLNF